jgi:hypothetical protein
MAAEIMKWQIAGGDYREAAGPGAGVGQGDNSDARHKPRRSGRTIYRAAAQGRLWLPPPRPRCATAQTECGGYTTISCSRYCGGVANMAEQRLEKRLGTILAVALAAGARPEP